MKLLLTINENDFEPIDYTIRKVVRAVILDESKTKALFLGNALIGGGVEEGEIDEQALAREAMEEAGAKIEIIRPLGEAVAYRDVLKKKYVMHAYLCRLIGEQIAATTTDPLEQIEKAQWRDIHETIHYMEDKLVSLKEEQVTLGKEMFQRRMQHCMINSVFLKEALK